MYLIDKRYLTIFINGGWCLIEVEIGRHTFQFATVQGWFHHFIEEET